MQGDNVVTIEETMQMAYNCFVNKDFSMAKDYSLRAMTKDTQNIQAKEIYYFICLHIRRAQGVYCFLCIFPVTAFAGRVFPEPGTVLL